MKFLKIIGLFLITFVQAQTPVFNNDLDTLFMIQDQQLIINKGKVLFSTQGNIVFNGNSTSYKEIIFTLALEKISQKKEAVVYNKKGSASSFTIQESQLYYELNQKKYSMATFVENEDNWAIYNNLNDSLLAFIPNKNVSNPILFSIYYALWGKLNLKKDLIALTSNTNSANEGLGVIQSVFGNDIVWIWDGRHLYPNGAALSNPMVWIYEGGKLNPRNYPRTQEEWAWDGSSLKPYWGGAPQSQWTWQNGILRQVWNNNYKNEYFIEDNVIRKRFGNFGDNEWEMQGDIPLPIITAIVLGILYR